jgi:hypothetical protein
VRNPAAFFPWTEAILAWQSPIRTTFTSAAARFGRRYSKQSRTAVPRSGGKPALQLWLLPWLGTFSLDLGA